MMIAQDQISVECYEREQDGWHYVHLIKRDDELRLRHTEITLKLADIYEGIDFDSPS